MKKLISLFMAMILCVCIMLPSFAASAESETPVFDYYKGAGSHEVSDFTFNLTVKETNSDPAEIKDLTYKVWYPSDIADMKKCPVLVFNNATGYTYENETVGAGAILEIAASRGYICIDNTDPRTGTGKSMDAGFSKLLKLNNDSSSPLYGKVDYNKTVLAGHSQGCGGCVNMADATQYANAKYYKAIYCASIVTEATANNAMNNVPYFPAHTTVPALMICGDGFLERGISTPDGCLIPFKTKSKGDVYIAQIKSTDHQNTLSKTYPYMLAWFDFKLYGNELAAKAFTGSAPELKTNPAWTGYARKIYTNKSSISKLVSTKTTVTVRWKKAAYVTGYELEYSRYSSFKKYKKLKFKSASTVSKKIKKLSRKKKYYFRVRTYRVYDGKTITTKWSAKKAIKTK